MENRESKFLSSKRASKSPLNFYRLAKERDSVLAENLLQLAAQNPNNKTFFVSGGFHRQAITETLKKNGISYVVLSPKITAKDGAENYWRALGGYKDNLETNLAAMTVKLQDQFQIS